MIERNLLIVDDDKSILELITHVAKKFKVRTYTTTDPKDALEMFDKRYFELVITDLKMPGINGIDFIKKIRASKNLDFYLIAITAALHEFNTSLALLDKIHVLEKPLKANVINKIFSNMFTPASNGLVTLTPEKLRERVAEEVVENTKYLLDIILDNKARVSISEGKQDLISSSYFITVPISAWSGTFTTIFCIDKDLAKTIVTSLGNGDESAKNYLEIIYVFINSIVNKVVIGLDYRKKQSSSGVLSITGTPNENHLFQADNYASVKHIQIDTNDGGMKICLFCK